MRHQLLDETKNSSVSIEICAELLGVSSATVRNWLKTGYLLPASKGEVSIDSIENFKTNFLGKEKLNQRANKSSKDSHDHDELSLNFLKKIDSKDENSNLLGVEYENALSDSYRNKEGIYYTPENIILDLLSIIESNPANKTFCDPCCGSGNFLIQALDIGFKPENIYGYDTDPIAVAITKKRIYEKTGFISQNIKCLDFLTLATSKEHETYDFIFTNPPWGKKITKDTKIFISQILSAGSSNDTCSLFYFACLKYLKTNGKLGLLLPEAFFNVSTYEDARSSVLSYKIEKLCHYGKPFKGILAGAVGLTLTKLHLDQKYLIDCKHLNRSFKRDVDSFKHNPKCIFNVSCTQEDADVISHFYSIPHLTLHNHCLWGLGIVTGNNSKFIEKNYRKGLIPVYKGADIKKNNINPASNYIPEDLSIYQQVAPIHLYQAKEKLIYKFISSNLCFFYDTEKRFIINSANMLIVNDDFPIPMKIIGSLFNSEIMNWIFSKIFDTHKILRGDLELLPIHTQFLQGNSFSESDFLSSINVERTINGTFRVKK